MNWFWLACAAITGLVAGYFVGDWALANVWPSEWQADIRRLSRNLATDRDFVLRVLRREVANWMFRRDPDRYHRIYKEAHEAAAAIIAAVPRDQEAQLAKLCTQYPNFADFDLLGSREHVQYADALSMNSYDQIERHFTNIIRFHALQFALDENWRGLLATGATSGDDLVHLGKYVQRFKDTRFKSRLKDAIREFYAYQRGKYDALGLGDPREEPPYETAAFSVRWVPTSSRLTMSPFQGHERIWPLHDRFLPRRARHEAL